MKLKVLGILTGAALLGLQSVPASAHTDVSIGLEFGIPAPVVVERYPAHYYAYDPEPVYYYEYREYPRRVYYEREVRYYERHDHGRHRGHYKHRHER